MFNHARTLLLNTAPEFLPHIPGEELMPPEYSPISLPTYLQTLRAKIFGVAPDKAMLNYRAAGILRIIAATQLQEYITSLDSRLTYDAEANLFSSQDFSPQIKQTRGTAQLSILGQPIAPDAAGQLNYSFNVESLNNSVTVQRLSLPAITTTEPLVFTDSLSQEIELPYCGYSFRISGSSYSAWRINGLLRPRTSLSQIHTNLLQSGEPLLRQLFGVSAVEPYSTFEQCQKHPDFAYRLGGFVLAMIYRTEELRNG